MQTNGPSHGPCRWYGCGYFCVKRPLSFDEKLYGSTAARRQGKAPCTLVFVIPAMTAEIRYARRGWPRCPKWSVPYEEVKLRSRAGYRNRLEDLRFEFTAEPPTDMTLAVDR